MLLANQYQHSSESDSKSDSTLLDLMFVRYIEDVH